MISKKQKLVLIDGNALIHRAFHALPPLTTKKGELVNAVFGFTSILLKAIKELQPSHIAVAFDVKRETFRTKEYKEYKATRVKAPQELYDQIPRVKDVVTAMNIPQFAVEGFEADDVIGTLAHASEIPVIIVTGDNDVLQLVDKKVQVYTLRRGVADTILYDRKKVIEKYGFSPEQLTDYKGLAGDSSDNIPGVSGIGEKTATTLLQKFGTLEKLYSALETGKTNGLSDTVVKKLTRDKKNAFLSKKLGTIVTAVPITLKLPECELADFDHGKVAKLFGELEFKSLLAKIPASKPVGAQSSLFGKSGMPASSATAPVSLTGPDYSYELIDNEAKAKVLFHELTHAKLIAVDTETTSENPTEADLVGISVSARIGHAAFVYADFLNEHNDIQKQLKSILEDPAISKTGHNIKYDDIVLRRHGITLQGITFDSMVASYLLNSSTRQHNLDALTFTEFTHQMVSYDELVGKGKDRILITDIPRERLAYYSSEDADYTLRLTQTYAERLKKVPALLKLMNEIEMPLVSVLARMEENGIKIDLDVLLLLSEDFSKRIAATEKDIFSHAGTKEFNPHSTQQLSKVLFETLKLPTADIKKTTTGYSTASSELEKLRGLHPIVTAIEEYRELTKLMSTYIEALPKLLNKKTGRVHTSFNQAVTTTGRLSSSDPNLQNIPIRTETGRAIRKAFIAEEGFTLLSGDYSQIDLRVLAHVAKDPNMLAAFRNNEDIHAATAAAVFEKDIANVSSDERRIAKTVNFGIVYGMSAFGLARALTIERAEAQDFIDRYFKKYHRLKEYMETTLAFARKEGYVETLLGRRRYLPELVGGNPRIIPGAERMAINMPIQGTTADILKIAMDQVASADLVQSVDCKLLLQVHDELVFEVREKMLSELTKKIKTIMESAYPFSIPLKVECAAGKNWGELTDL